MNRIDLEFLSTKTYTHSVGLSCCFRQWRADSHCKNLHGYALEVKLTFKGVLDKNNWVVDFGSLKPIKKWLEDTFDHKLLVARDDPECLTLLALESVADIKLVDHVGCEAFAYQIYEHVEAWVSSSIIGDRIKLTEVEVREHAGNSAIVQQKHWRS